MTETPEVPDIPAPIITITYSYRVNWSIPGGTVNDTVKDDEGNETENPFPTTGTLNSVDITPYFDFDNESYDPYNYEKVYNLNVDGDTRKVGQGKFTIQGKVQLVTRIDEETFNEDGGSNGVTTEYQFTDVPYILNSLTIRSRHPENSQWIYPDQFPGATVPPETPKEYGGIVLADASPVPVSKMAGEFSSCGSVEGSGYQYLDVFYDYDFKYHQRNSVKFGNEGEYIDVDVKDSRDRFPTKPRFPDVKDEDGLIAHILPIDVITSYVGDESESYSIIYTVTMSTNIGPTPDGFSSGLVNPTITVTQVVTQNTEEFGNQLKALLGICNFTYPGTYGVDYKDLAPGYPYAYPYTVVSGYDGQPAEGIPTSRNIIEKKSEGPLQKGDVWYSEFTGERKYYQVNSFVEDVKIISQGTIYQGKTQPKDFGEMFMKNMEIMKGLDNIGLSIDKYLEGDAATALAELKGNSLTFEEAAMEANENTSLKKIENVTAYPVTQKKISDRGDGFFEMNMDSKGTNLLVDIEVDGEGRVVTATVVNGGIGYTNGERVALQGGDCILELQVNTDEFWRDEYVDRLDLPKRQFIGGFNE